MNLRIDIEGLYIRAFIVQNGRAAILRRWPWPNNAGGRKKHYHDAMDYTTRVSSVLACPVEFISKELV